MLVPTGRPELPHLCFAPAFPHAPRSALDATRAARRAIAAHNAAAAAEGRARIGRAITCALGTFEGCVHQAEAAEQMAAAFSESYERGC